MSKTVVDVKDWSSPELGKAIEQFNWLSGGVLYDVEAKNRYQRWHFFLLKLNTFILVLELFYFTFFVPFDLLNFIATGIQLCFIIVILFIAPWSEKQRANTVMILNWVAIFPKKEYPIKKKSIKKLIKKADKYSLLCISLIKLLVSLTGLFLAFGFPLFRYFIVKEKFALPFSAHLPFLQPTNVVFYLVNYSHQVYALAFIVLTLNLVTVYGFCSFIHAIYFLKSVTVLTKNMSKGIEAVGFQKWHESIINTTIEIKSHMRIFCIEIFSSVIYVSEKLTYALLIVLWLTLKTDDKLLPWALAGCCISLMVIAVVVINEINLDQFDELDFELYAQPWLELTPKERYALQLTMIQFQRPICLTTGLENLTFEWLVKLAKAGYSMGVVMDKLITNE